MAVKVATWQDWTDYFEAWKREIGMVGEHVGDYRFEARFDDIHPEIEFGDFRGARKWETVLEIPDQRIRDACEYLIAVQGDTEFASVEQQRALYDTAPSDYLPGARPREPGGDAPRLPDGVPPRPPLR